MKEEERLNSNIINFLNIGKYYGPGIKMTGKSREEIGECLKKLLKDHVNRNSDQR